MNNRNRYPTNWEKISHVVRFAFFHGKCANCSLEHGQIGYYVNGQFFTEGPPVDRYDALREKKYTHEQASKMTEIHGPKVIRIVTQCAHVDRDTSNNSLDNFVALCEKCHLLYDEGQRQRSVKYGNDTQQLDLFSDKAL